MTRERIVDHARIRSEYERIASVSSAEHARATGAAEQQHGSASECSGSCDAKRRREARLLLRAVARLGTRGAVARQLAYWSIDAVIDRRRAHEHDAARVRWEAAKIVLASERRLVREEKPMDYRSFVGERARVGRSGGAAGLDALVAPARNRREPCRTVSLVR